MYKHPVGSKHNRQQRCRPCLKPFSPKPARSASSLNSLNFSILEKIDHVHGILIVKIAIMLIKNGIDLQNKVRLLIEPRLKDTLGRIKINMLSELLFLGRLNPGDFFAQILALNVVNLANQKLIIIRATTKNFDTMSFGFAELVMQILNEPSPLYATSLGQRRCQWCDSSPGHRVQCSLRLRLGRSGRSWGGQEHS